MSIFLTVTLVNEYLKHTQAPNFNLIKHLKFLSYEKSVAVSLNVFSASLIFCKFPLICKKEKKTQMFPELLI